MSAGRIGGTLPEGDANGLAVIVRELIDNPHKLHVMLAIIDCKKCTTDNDTGEVIPTARIRRVEVVLPADLAAAEKLMRRAVEKRSGQTVLPLDLEDDMRAAFKDIIGKLKSEGENPEGWEP